jgi:hypothetical protein
VYFVDANYAENMLAAYEEARLVGSYIYDQEKLAAHWVGKTEGFSDRLARACQTEADLDAMDIPVPTPLSEASQTLIRIVELCQKHYELYA